MTRSNFIKFIGIAFFLGLMNLVPEMGRIASELRAK